MDLNFSQDSFAFSDIVAPSHVSGLESFSDFDASECSEASFAEIVPNKDINTDLGTSLTGENVGQTDGSVEKWKESSATEQSSLGLQELNSNNINEFFEAIHNAESLGFVASSESGKSVTGDESSLGILQLDGLPDLSDNFQNPAGSTEASLMLERTLIGDEEDGNDLGEVVLNHYTVDGNQQEGEDIPFTNGFHPASDQTSVVNKNTVMQLEEERPDTGQDPDTFFSSHSIQANDDFQESVNEETLQHSYGQEELDMMLQRRAGSGDGGELIDRVSLTSSISFIQSQTFPDSIFSQSFGSSRGLGSGMDSRSESDGHEDNDEVTSPLLHGAGDGSNDSRGRPGLEGANSDVEDLQLQNGPSLDASNRQETQAIELRQSAEGVDVLPDILGDGGGGGDGSSGNNSDTDDGGPAGAAYASSTASSLPSLTFPPSIMSFGFVNQSMGGNFQGTSSLPASDSLTAGRGCPVGDAAAERSPVLSPSPPDWINRLHDSVTMPHSLHFQASSTPMVREGAPQNCDNTGTHNETSALESCYLMGHNAATPRSAWAEDGSFHMSQMLGNKQSNSLVDAESLNFDPTTIDAAHNASQDEDKTLISNETAFEGYSNQELDQRSGSWHGDGSAVSATINQSSPDFSIKFGNSIFINGDSAIDSSKLWKSTPRDEEEDGIRSTPGVVFQGNQRPSTVTGQLVVNNQHARTEHSSDGDPSTTLASGVTTWREGNSRGLVDLSSGQNGVDLPTDRTLTPGGVGDDTSIQQTAAPWEIDKMSSCPWPDGAGGMQDSILRSNPFEGSIDQQPWPFGESGAVSEEDQPFGGGSKRFSWTGSDFGFEVQGDAEAIIAAGEESFNREHELEIPSHTQINDTTKLHDWTVPESHFLTRPSLLQVVGINDPNGLGEVRISFGAFLAAGSGELGSLSRTSPDRPRPHFGDDKPILTPSPQPPVRMISKPSTPFDQFMQESNPPDVLSNRTSADGGIKEVLQQQPKHVAKKPQKHDQLKKEESLEAGSCPGTSKSQGLAAAGPEELSLEMQKMKLDEQFKVDSTFKSRSRTASQTSSQSSSSKGSIKSVVKIDSSQSVQPSKNIAGDIRSKPKEGKRLHRKEKEESQIVSTNPLDVSSRSELGFQQELQELYIHSSRIGSPRRSSVGDVSSASSLEKMTQFIAKAINEDPDEIRKKLTAVEKKKSKAKLRRKRISSSEVESISPSSRTSDFNPVSSSSPQTKSSPEKLAYSPGRAQGIVPNNNSDSLDKLESYSIEDSVFRSHDSPSMIPLSMKELDSKDFPSEQESMSSSEMGNFQHVIPQFGETYTLRKPSEDNNQHLNAPMVDPRKHRTHEIEQRLNRSLPKDEDHDNFSHPPMATRQLHPLIQESTMWQSESSSPRQRLETSDSAVGSMTTSLSEDVTTTRHSWPEATPSRWYKTREDSRWAANVQNYASQLSGANATVGLMTRVTANDNVKVAVQTSNLNEGLPSSLLMHGHRPASLTNHNSSPLSIPFSTSQGIVPLVNQGTISHLYPGGNINGSIGLPGLAGPIYPGNGLSIQTHGPLSHTAPVGYGPRMAPVGSAMYPGHGHGLINTLHGQVPLVHTVSASMGPKPSSLTPTYVRSIDVNIPHSSNSQYEPTHQLPLQFQSNPSNISGFPATFTQPKIPASLPFHQPSFQHDPNGLLQVRPEFSRERMLQSPSQLIIPGEIKVPSFCCVGVLTETVIPLHNSSSRWMHCEIHSILSTVNGVQVPSSSSAFSHQLKAIIGPHTTENIKLSIEPKEAGTLTTQLQVYSFPVVCEVQQVTHSVGPVLALEVVAEEPQVEVVLEDENSIFFGEVSCGAKQCRPIHLVNRGRAQVPIRIIISANSSSLNCFAFADADFMPKTDVVRGPASAGAKGSALTIHTLFIKGRKELTSKVEPTVVWLLFQSPNMSIKSPTSVGPAAEYTARLDVEIDSAQQGLTISSIALKALEGIVRLHTPHKLQVVTLKSPVGKSTSCTIPVKNAGNITAKVNLRIEGDSKQFSVKPAQLRVKPEEESEVQVMFQPTEGDKQVESLVILAVPNGPVYELVLKGSALPKEDDKFALLSSKPVLCWSGVALGWSQQQKVILKTSSATPVKLQLMIEGNHSDYQIQPMFSSHGGSPEHPQATLEPKKELPVHVSFSPSSMGLISSSLVIKSLAGKTKSKIPLYGCGGTSQLVLVDIRQLSEGYVTNIGEVSLGKKNSVKVVVRNSGTRAAFVKAICYSDIHTLQRYPSSHLKIHPDSFVLSERTSRAVLIEYQPLEKDAVNCRTSVNSVAVVAFYTGDEFLRRQYKKNLHTQPLQPSSKIMERSLLTGINFTTAFQDEDKLVEDVKYPKVASWDSFFQGSVSRVLLTLVGSPPGSSPNNKPDPNRSVDTVPVSDKQAVKFQETSPINGNLAAEFWTVIPDFLTLSPCNSKDDKSGKGSDQLRILNFSDRSIGFEFTWPAHSIVITPERGEIPPRSQARVLVSSKSNLSSSSTPLPWGGTIYLKCDGKQQAIRVQIREERILENSPHQSGTSNFQSIPTMVTGNTPLPTNHLPPLRIKNKDIVFERTMIGTVTTSEISLTNTASENLTWNLSSVAPAYVKVDDTGNICRTTYLAFSMAKQEGTIQAGRTTKIFVKFQPRDAGEYEQSWDLMTASDANKSKQKIFLHGQAIDRTDEFVEPSEDIDTFLPAKSKKVTIKEPLRSPKNVKKGLYIKENVLKFPVTAAGATSEAQLKICNGSKDDQYGVRVSSMKTPFSVQISKFSVRALRFVRLPVRFSPTEPGKSYEASLVITADPDVIITVQLQGSSSD